MAYRINSRADWRALQLSALLAAWFVPFAALAQLPQPVESAPLGAIDPFLVGVTQPSVPAEIWRNADPVVLATVFQRLAARPFDDAASPAVLTAQRSLLAAAVAGPAAGDDPNALQLHRLRAIYNAGGVAMVRAMAPRLPGFDQADYQLLSADTALLAGRVDEACGTERSVGAARQQAAWLRLRLMCLAVARDPATEMTVTLARGANLRDEGFFSAIHVLQGGAVPKAMSVRTALDLATARQVGHWAQVDVRKAPLPVLVSLAEAADVPPERRLGPAWRAAAAGGLDAPALQAVILAQKGPDAPVAADLTAARVLPGLFGTARLARIALSVTPAASPLALDAAVAAMARTASAGEVMALARVLHPVWSALDAEALAARPDAAQLARYAALGGAHDHAARLARDAKDPALAALLALARDDGPAVGKALEGWIAAAQKSAPTAAQLARFYPVLSAVGAPVAAPAQRMALDMPGVAVTGGTPPAQGVMAALLSAVARKAPGEAASLALMALSDTPPARMDVASLSSLLGAMTTGGLGSHARAIALEDMVARTVVPAQS